MLVGHHGLFDYEFPVLLSLCDLEPECLQKRDQEPLISMSGKIDQIVSVSLGIPENRLQQLFAELLPAELGFHLEGTDFEDSRTSVLSIGVRVSFRLVDHNPRKLSIDLNDPAIPVLRDTFLRPPSVKVGISLSQAV